MPADDGANDPSLPVLAKDRNLVALHGLGGAFDPCPRP